MCCSYKYVYRTVSIEVNKHIVIGGFDCRFHFCAIKDHPSRQNAFLEANTPVYYFHYCFEPTCSPSKLHNMVRRVLAVDYECLASTKVYVSVCITRCCCANRRKSILLLMLLMSMPKLRLKERAK